MAATLKRHRSSEGSVTRQKKENSPAEVSAQLGADALRLIRKRIHFQGSLAKANYAELNATKTEYRKVLVDCLSEIAQEIKLNWTTTHVAVSYLDRILCSSHVSRNELMLVALTCLLLATKHEEGHRRGSTLDSLLDSYSRCCSGAEAIYVEDVLQMEMIVAAGLEYRLLSFSAAHLVDTLHSFGYLFCPSLGDQVPIWMDLNNELDLPTDIAKFAKFFANVSLQHVPMQILSSQALVMVIVACARQAKGVFPLCPMYLQEVTSIEFDINLDRYQKELWDIYCTTYREEQEENTQPNHTKVDECATKVSPDGPFNLDRATLKVRQ